MPEAAPAAATHSGSQRDEEHLTPISAVLAQVLAALSPATPLPVSLEEALGCVLAEALVASEDVPPFACSAMDGYAVRSEDVTSAPVELAVVASTMAGDAPAGEIGPGQAARIMTGAPLPPGADAIVIVEITSPGAGPGTVWIREAARPGQFVRPAGDDVSTGEVVLRPGTVLGPAHLGVAASLGRVRLVVHPRPRVGVLSTGDELHAGSGPLPAGAIRDSNSVAISAELARSGCVALRLGSVPDEEDAVVDAISDAVRGCDVVITTGGVSVGDRDVLKPALARLAGAGAHAFTVAVKPAKPFAFAELPGGSLAFALPGNPVSAMVSFELFVRPALRKLAGHRSLHRPTVLGVADGALRRRRDGKVHLVRVRAAAGPDGRVQVSSAGAQGSHQLSTLAAADALAVLPDGEGVESGASVEVLLLDAGDLASMPPALLAASPAGGEAAGTPAPPPEQQLDDTPQPR